MTIEEFDAKQSIDRATFIARLEAKAAGRALWEANMARAAAKRTKPKNPRGKPLGGVCAGCGLPSHKFPIPRQTMYGMSTGEICQPCQDKWRENYRGI